MLFPQVVSAAELESVPGDVSTSILVGDVQYSSNYCFADSVVSPIYVYPRSGIPYWAQADTYPPEYYEHIPAVPVDIPNSTWMVNGVTLT